jgi:hypothetical protein
MKVILSSLAHLKIKYYINSVNTEISGVGLVEKRDGNLFVPDVFLFKQKVTGAETKLDVKSVTDFALEKLNIPDFPVENLKLWWHSHVDMGCFWSGTDESTIDGLDLDLKEENWWLSMVCTRDGKRRARIDTYQPFRLTVDELEVSVGEDLDLKESIEKEVEELVTEDSYKGGQIFGPDNKPIGLPGTGRDVSAFVGQPFQNHHGKKKHWRH